MTIKKPVFVPRHLRGIQKAAEKQEEQEEKLAKTKTEKLEKRKQESRALVQEVVSTVSKRNALDVDDDGTMNAIPDDDDTDDRDAWEVRELLRLLEDWEVEQQRIQARRDLMRRRNMTEEEKLQEDIATGRYRQPGQQRKRPHDEGANNNTLTLQSQRYFHRGAFYMDESEWDKKVQQGNNSSNNNGGGKTDVRHRAAEYAQAATESDRTFLSSTAAAAAAASGASKDLPDIIRKSKAGKFGRANQNLRYQGLAKEDTSDRSWLYSSTQNKKK